MSGSNEENLVNDTIINGVYSGSLKSNKPIVDFLGVGAVFKSSVIFQKLDTSVVFQPFIERHGSYAAFNYFPVQNERGLQLIYRDSLWVNKDDAMVQFHEGQFMQDLHFSIQEEGDSIRLYNEDLDMKLFYLEYETNFMDSLLADTTSQSEPIVE